MKGSQMMRMRNVGRNVFGWMGQIGVSVLATVIATGLYSGWQQDHGAPDIKAAGPAMTNGGKFAAKVDGITPEPGSLLALPRPTLSIVNWAITPTRSRLLIDDVGWDVLRDDSANQFLPSAKPVKAAHEGRRVLAAAAPPDPASSPRVAAAAIPQLDLQTVPAIQATASGAGQWWSTAKAAMSTVSSMGTSLLSRANPF